MLRCPKIVENAIKSKKFLYRRFANRVSMVLKEDVEFVGLKGDLVNVKAGFGRNYLYPKKYAVYATEANVEKYFIDRKEDEMESSEAAKKKEFEAMIKKLTSVELTFKRHCGTGQNNPKNPVTVQNISDALEKQAGLLVGVDRIRLAQPLKTLGNHNVKVRVDDDILKELEEGKVDDTVESKEEEHEDEDEAAVESEISIKSDEIMDSLDSSDSSDSTDSTAENSKTNSSSKRAVKVKVFISKR